MSQPDNPFVRGYQNLRIERKVLITYEVDSPPVRLSLHASQAHLPDEQIETFPCAFNAEFAIIIEGQSTPEALQAQCHTEGIVITVLYAIVAEDFYGNPVLIGDRYHLEAAQETVRRLSFETGHYSRCWEISSQHLLTIEAGDFLRRLASDVAPNVSLFSAFHVDYRTIGVKLWATPWTDAHLQSVEGFTAEQLLQKHRAEGLPEPLITILHLAALADVRILIFDPDAPTLTGLPNYER